MVNIITGEINTGKTTKLLSLYSEKKLGDGFVTLKIYSNSRYIGQKLMRLSTGEETCFSFKDEYLPVGWDEECRYDIYSFSKKGITFAENIIEDVIRRRLNPVFIDEIGPLELQCKGFYNVFYRSLSECKDIYFTVRTSSLDDVIIAFGIKDYDIIKIM